MIKGQAMDELGQTAAQSVIHRKARVARDEFDAREMSPPKAFRLAMAKSAEALFRLPLVVRTVEQTTIPLQQMEEAAGDGDLLILLDGPDGMRGAVRLDTAIVTSLIEVQLVGHLRQDPAAERTFTHTDAAIAQPLINDVLARFDTALAEEGVQSGAQGFRFGDMVDSARMLVLALDAPDFEMYRLTVDLGPGARMAVLHIFLPHRPPGVDVASETAQGGLASRLEAQAMNAPVALNAALTRLRIPFNQICSWAPGTVLTVGSGAANEGVLLGAGEHEVARIRLGQLNGFRAIQLMTDSQPQEDAEEIAPTATEQNALPVPSVDFQTAEPGLAALDVFPGTDAPDDLENALLGEPDATADALPDPEEPGWSALDGMHDPGDAGAESPLDETEGLLLTEAPAGDDGDFEPLPMAIAEISLDD
ncbi:MAG: FliM/FliN family flagellar motor switch protein [Pseudomonadota bacterium]